MTDQGQPKRKIQLLTCFDSRYFAPALISAFSYLKNSHLDLTFTFYADSSIGEDQRDLVYRLFPDSRVLILHPKHETLIHKIAGIMGPRFPPSALYRLLCLDEIPNIPTLYCDADTLCVRSLEGLLSIFDRLERSPSKLIAAASHFRPLSWEGRQLEHLNAHGFSNSFEYFNAGVLLFYPRRLSGSINHSVLERFCSSEYSHLINHTSVWFYADQTVLNLQCRNKVIFLDWRYNTLSWMFKHDTAGMRPLCNYLANILDMSPERSLEESRIIHYTGKKPWDTPRHKRSKSQNISFECWTTYEDMFQEHASSK